MTKRWGTLRKGRTLALIGLSVLMPVGASMVGASAAMAKTAPAASQAKIHFRMMDWQGQDLYTTGYNNMIRAYEKLHPNISITQVFVPQGTGYESLLQTGYLAGSAPSLVELQQPNYETFYNDGYLVNLNPYMVKPTPYSHGTPWVDTFIGGPTGFQSIQEGNSAGAINVVPVDGDGNGPASWLGFYTNLNILHKSGIQHVPTTYAQFIADCAKIKKAGYTPIVADNDRWLAWVWYTLGAQMGNNYAAKFFPKKYAVPLLAPDEWAVAILDGKINAQDPLDLSMAKIAKSLVPYFQSGWVGTTINEGKILWMAGGGAFRMTGSWNYGWYQKNVKGFKFTVLGWPVYVLPKSASPYADQAWVKSGGQITSGWSVNAKLLKNPAKLRAVIDFLQYATSQSAQRAFSAVADSMPEVSGVPIPPEDKPFVLPNSADTLATPASTASPNAPPLMQNTATMAALSQEYLNGQISLHQFMTTMVADDIPYLRTEFENNIFSPKTGLPPQIKADMATLKQDEREHAAKVVIASAQQALSLAQLRLQFYDRYALPYMKK